MAPFCARRGVWSNYGTLRLKRGTLVLNPPQVKDWHVALLVAASPVIVTHLIIVGVPMAAAWDGGGNECIRRSRRGSGR